MKLKTDFVTNSSCASFVVEKRHISNIQLYLILNHFEIAKVYDPPSLGYVEKCGHSGWTITETEETIEGSTSMDNFDMIKFLIDIGINEEHIDNEGCY